MITLTQAERDYLSAASGLLHSNHPAVAATLQELAKRSEPDPTIEELILGFHANPCGETKFKLWDRLWPVPGSSVTYRGVEYTALNKKACIYIN